MAILPPTAQPDPTLEAMDAAMVARQHTMPRREYLGMSAIGHPCSRKLWYDLNSPVREVFDAATLKRFEGGHAGEATMIVRLRLVEGITLLDVDPDTGRQWEYKDLGGRFCGHMDGAIHGLRQAPSTWHCYEHKQTNEKKQTTLARLKASKGEKDALQAWDETYYAQAVVYMHYSGLTRHYLTCSSPGERATVSVRTDADPAHAARLRDKAERILSARAPLARISNDPSWFQCSWCGHHARCHGEVQS